MASEREIFSLSGPQFLSAPIDWRKETHRRCIAASLVKGVYILERDRQENRHGAQAHAPPWWESFNFRLLEVLKDYKDQSYFGAIYEYNNNQNQNQNQKPPNYVIAFRGTIAKRASILQDFKLNRRVIFNSLRDSSRFPIALQVVQNIVHQNYGVSDIWLAGHSLGASIALLSGRHMAKMGIYLETYLFNPPFASLPIDKIIKNETLRHGIRCFHSALNAGLALAVNMSTHDNHQSTSDAFTQLSKWTPYVFVNPSDLICSEYIGYFKHREKMVDFGAEGLARMATQHSLRSSIATAGGKESEPSQHLPSAYVTTNLRPSPDLKRAHALSQWWTPDLDCSCKLYRLC